MSTTATFTVSNPASGTEYIAPAGYWVVPTNGSVVTCTAQTFDSLGNLQTVTTLEAVVRDVSTSADAGTYTGANAYSTSAATSNGVNGSHVFAAAAKITGSCAQLRMYLTYTGSTYDQAPNTPTGLSPASGATVLSQTPTFQATFSDPTSGDTLAKYEIQIANTSLTILNDTGNITANSTEIANGKVNHVSAYSLSFGTSYNWRVRVANQNGLWSNWTSWVPFSCVAGPNYASQIAPSGNVTSLTPGFSFLYTSPTATALAQYRILVGSGVTTNYDSGWVTDSVASGTTVTGTIPSGANLQNGHSYFIQINVQDSGSAQSGYCPPVNFQVPALPSATPTTPINGAIVTTHTPTLHWSFSDPGGYTQASYRVQVINATTGASIEDSGVVSSAANSYTVVTSIAYNTHIQWRVEIVDSSGFASGYSPYAAAYVNNAPSATITAPVASSTIVTNTPTITWTYTASTGGQVQASASILIMDTSNNVLYTGNVTGTGTSFNLPSGILANNTTYHLQVDVTDTASNTGASSIIAFTLAYSPPADMQGQPLSTQKNYIPGNPYLNVDGGSGRPTGWTGFQSSGVGTWTAQIDIDPTVQQQIQLANGDGPVQGAQQLGVPTSAATGFVQITSHIDCFPNSGFTPGTTVLSLSAYVMVQALSGAPKVRLNITYQDSSFSTIRTDSGSNQFDTSGEVVLLLGPQNSLIPALTAHVYVELEFQSPTNADLGFGWFMAAMLNAASASLNNFIAGDLGTGYSYDINNFSTRTFLAGNLPTLTANPGLSTDPVGGQGGTITITWDTTLADSRFTAYVIERRRMDQQADDTAWVTVASITNSTVNFFTDYTAGGSTTYQYSVRQTIIYSDGSNGISENRAIVIGSVIFSPAWYLVNTDSLIYNLRLNIIDIKRKTSWKENAQYTPFLGRLGTARDAGPAAGYLFQLLAYFDDTWGDVRSAVRRQFVTMQQLGVVWNLKDPEGLVVPVHFQDFDIDEEDTYSDTLMTATLNFLQAADTPDF